MTGPWMATIVGLWVVVVLLALLVAGLLRRLSSILERAENTSDVHKPIQITGLRPGAHVPEFTVESIDGHTTSPLRELAGRSVVFLLLSSGCAPCRQLAHEIEQTQVSTYPIELYVVLDEWEDWAPQPGSHMHVARQAGETASSALMSNAFPQAFLVDRQGDLLASVIPGSVNDLHDLIHRHRDQMGIEQSTSPESNAHGDLDLKRMSPASAEAGR